jgi:hypothetical protein
MQKRTKFIYRIFLGLLVLLGPVASSWANKLRLPADIINEILSEAVPSANPLADLQVDDFEPFWEGSALPNVSVVLEKESLQWVRTLDVLVLPRARMRLTFATPTTLRVYQGAFSTGGRLLDQIDFPVALMNNSQNIIRVRIEENGQEVERQLRIRFRPRMASHQQLVYIDSSCSRYNVKADWLSLPESKPPLQASWAYLGCRFLTTKGDQFRTSALEMYIYWDGLTEDSAIAVDRLRTEPILPGVWALRLSSLPGRILLKNAQGQELQINYNLSERHYLGSLGVGIGPYFSEFNGVGEYDLGWSPLLTIYGSVFINESIRVVGFDATSISNRLWTDLGLYLSAENAKMFDERMTMSLLIGGHVIAFRTDGKNHAEPSFPQGFEFIYADAFKRGHSMSFGGFVYPEIAGRSYYNLWIRWGGKIFGEINFLEAKESFDNESVSSKSLGLTFGFPLGRFW